jgi:hypothetical protein
MAPSCSLRHHSSPTNACQATYRVPRTVVSAHECLVVDDVARNAHMAE